MEITATPIDDLVLRSIAVGRKVPLFHGVRISIPNWKPSPNRTSIGFSQIAFSHNSPAKG